MTENELKAINFIPCCKSDSEQFSFAKYREGSLETIGIHFDGNKVKYSDPQEYDEYANDIPKMNPNDDENFYDA